MAKLIAYDLGPDGIKASLHNEDGSIITTTFVGYETDYPQPQWHEQRPMDWWDGLCRGTAILLKKGGTNPRDVAGLALSGHSLVAAPIGENGELLMDRVPIWSDTRAETVLDGFFEKIPYRKWYATTGNGDPPACYSIFKLMWMKEHQPEIFARTKKVLGSKDFINFMLTGEMATDPSYASGSGVFDLLNWRYADDFIEASGIPRAIFPDILPSHAIVGHVTKAAAEATGLAAGTPVACGGVDNSCMALGALGIREGEAYVSLGSSCWIAANTKKPLIETRFYPFTFAHIEEGYYTSAMSIFAAGSALKWVKNQLCRDIADDRDAFQRMDAWAEKVPVGSNGVLFNPSLAGGSTQERSVYIQGAFLGLSLASTREDMIRATMEGITMNMRLLLGEMETHIGVSKKILLCGGGSSSALWRRMFADIFNKTIIKTNVDEETVLLGAVGIAARASGLWKDYAPIMKIHHTQTEDEPDARRAAQYGKILRHFSTSRDYLAEIGDLLHDE